MKNNSVGFPAALARFALALALVPALTGCGGGTVNDIEGDLRGAVTSADIAAAIGSSGDVLLDLRDATSIDGVSVMNDQASKKIGDCFNTDAKGRARVKGLILPDGMRDIGDGAFFSCIGLTSVILPSRLRTIGDLAFTGCTNLVNVTFKSTISETDFSESAGFPGNDLRAQYLSGGIGAYTRDWRNTWTKQ